MSPCDYPDLHPQVPTAGIQPAPRIINNPLLNWVDSTTKAVRHSRRLSSDSEPVPGCIDWHIPCMAAPSILPSSCEPRPASGYGCLRTLQGRPDEIFGRQSWARWTSLKGKESAKNYVYRLYVTGPGARIILICISNFSHALLLVTRVVLPVIGDRHRGIVDNRRSGDTHGICDQSNYG